MDQDGNRTYLQVPGYYTIRYGYTDRNQLAHIYDGNWTPWFNYSYDAAGNLTKRQAVYGGANDSTNIPTEWYDALNRPTALENTKAGDVWFARSHYQYDNLGREVATWRDEQSNKGERYWYTAAGQLNVAEYNADNVWVYPQNWDRWVGYTYTPDTLNRSSVNDSGWITNYAVSPLNQYTAVNGETVYYDGNFNISMHGGWFYYYDAQNRLTSVRDYTGALFLQNTDDGLGRCVKRDRHDWGNFVELITYDGWKPIVEWDGAGNFQAWNVYGPGADEILWRYQTGIGHLRYHHDIHGNVTALLNWGGDVVEKYSYDAFGVPKVTDGWDTNSEYPRTWSSYNNRFMFTGREYFPGLWLYDYRNRWYDPGLGRFLQSDPLGFDGGDANLFRYCGGDPINLNDPSGLFSFLGIDLSAPGKPLPFNNFGVPFYGVCPSYGFPPSVGSQVAGVGAVAAGAALVAYPIEIVAGLGVGAFVAESMLPPNHNHLDDEHHEEVEFNPRTIWKQLNERELVVPYLYSTGGPNNQSFSALVGSAINNAVDALFNASGTLGPGIGYVTVTTSRGTEVVYSRVFAGGPYGGFAPGTEGYYNHMNSLSAAAGLYLATFAGGQPGEGAHLVTFDLY